ncbi:MAG TPA: IS1634 family transposase [Acetobacteraceae bacterium]|nr:IS1634 family transposase [Acetobacteraceae bacterium]
MFFRIKQSGPRRYLQIVENRREGGAVRQSVVATIGRADELAASGALATLLASGARHCEQVMLLSTLQADLDGPSVLARRIGAPLLFGRLWEQTGCRAVIEALLAGRGFEFAVERAVFATVLHRIMVSGSDRACEKWLADYDLPGVDGLALHHLYRAMAWLGEELPAEQQAGATPFAPRTVKDLVEEALFARRRDLFSELSVVFLDTTSLGFAGAGGETLGQRGYSKDHRPDLMQMILGVVVDAEGTPVCSEMWPGNTADVRVLVPVIDRLRGRFAIGRVCVVADRGMLSAATVTALEERGLEYVLGARERTDALVRQVVLADNRPFTPLCIPRAGDEETQLWVKEVSTEGRRYIACRNEAEAERDRADRQAIVAGLEQQLRRGDKALIGNSAYRRYLRRTGQGQAFEIDPGKLADEARYDGLFVLRTNARITPLQAVLRYRDLRQVEDLFRTAKALMRTRPIYHSSDAAIRGHVFCSFLALVLRKELDACCRRAGFRPEWGEVLRDLDRLQRAGIESGGKRWLVRTQADGCAAALLQVAGIALPPRIQATPPSPAAAGQPSPPQRRGRPRRGAMRT